MNPAFSASLNGSGDDAAPGILRRLARQPDRSQATAMCEMCSEAVDERHPHLVDTEDRRLMCACRPCHLLFTAEGATAGRFRAVPDRVTPLPTDAITPGLWERFQIPVAVAFLFFNSSQNAVVALYPGPAGVTESLLPMDAWSDLCEVVPQVASMEPDVEALLVRIRSQGALHALIVPVDRCYALAGRLRSVWRGIDGGAEARQLLDRTFEDLSGRRRETGAGK